MKNIFKLLLGSFLITAILVSCKKDEFKDYFLGGTAPVLAANKATTIPLSFATKSEEAIKLTWTNPAYRFTTGGSSQDVSYLLEIDTTGANFNSPIKQSIGISKDLEKSFTQDELNNYLLNQLLVTGIPHNIEMRIRAGLGDNATPLYSNVLKFVVTPYSIPPTVEPPTNGTLWITGDATGAGWANPLGVPYDQNQKFTKISATLFELTLNMPGGGGYKLIQQQGNWDTQYRMIAGGTWESGDFKKENSDPQFPGPPSAGSYKITVNFQTGKFKVVKL
ncbi:MAG: SusE domain-containing protein [Bacteroidota bacterium]